MIGAYGPWAAGLVGEGPARLSFRQGRFAAGGIEAGGSRRGGRLHECLMQPDTGGVPDGQVQHQLVYDGLHVEHLTWQLPYGPPTEAVFLKPAGARGGSRRCSACTTTAATSISAGARSPRSSDQLHPMMKEHRDDYYGKRELGQRAGQARVRGPGPRYVRVRQPAGARGRRAAGASQGPQGGQPRVGRGDQGVQQVRRASTSTSWPRASSAPGRPGRASSRPRTSARSTTSARAPTSTRPASAARDSPAAGCAPVYLAGLDDRIRCACCVGMMTTWRDYLLNKCHTHTWMIYIPGLPRDLDYPEILGLRVPLPTLVQNDTGGPALHGPRDASRRPDAGGGLRQGRRRRPLQVLVLSGPAQVRPAHAGRGVRLVRALAQVALHQCPEMTRLSDRRGVHPVPFTGLCALEAGLRPWRRRMEAATASPVHRASSRPQARR